MASLIGKRGRWSLQFRLRPDEDRQTIALGAMSPATARSFQERVEALVEAIRADNPPDPSTAKWVNGLSDAHHAKLAAVGLVTPRDNPEAAALTTLGRFLDEYIDKRKDVKRRTQRQSMGKSSGPWSNYFGATRPMDKITPGDCDDWRLWMLTEQKLADNTVRRRCSGARQFFRAAVRQQADCRESLRRYEGLFVCREFGTENTSSPAKRPSKCWTPAPTPNGGCCSP